MKTTTTIYRLSTFIALLFISSALFAQTGPGGVGNATGTAGQPENVIWLDADKLSLNNNDLVTDWTDNSGNGHFAYQGTDANKPTFITSVINGKPVIRFTAANSNYMMNSLGDELNAPFSVIIVGKFADASANYNMLNIGAGSNASGTENASVGRQNSSNRLFTYDGSSELISTVSDPLTDATQAFNIISSQYDSGTPYHTAYINGTDMVMQQSAGAISTNGDFALGHLPGIGDGSNFLDGDIAEVIIFNNNINDAQRIIIQNYLNEKYGITLDANDFYSTTASYNTELIGIGTTDGTIKHSESSGSGGALYLSEHNSSLNSSNEYLMAAHNNADHNITDTEVGPIETGRWTRIWEFEKTGTLDAVISFNPVEAGFLSPSDINDYTLLYRAGTSGDFSEVAYSNASVNGNKVEFTVPDSELNNGYYTLGVKQFKTWYSIGSGDWDKPENWTLDPSGFLELNPNGETPTTSSTSSLDDVVIKTGKTITVSTDSKENASLTVEGILDLTTSTGHTFTEIKGNGRIKLAEDNFPAGNASHFISEGQGEGTVVYYGGSYDLSVAREFYNIEVDNGGNTINLLSNYDINGNLRIKNGIFSINDATQTTPLTINLYGDLIIESAGKIHTGTENARHQFNFYGDLTNNGELKFTNRSAADYNNEATDGIVDANFLHDTKNQTISCNNVSNFYRIEIDKGADKTYELYITASNSDYFKLYGAADYGHGETAQLTVNNNALGLIKGTVRIGTNVNITTLNNTGNYNISEAARLWVDGGHVAKPAGTAIVPYGEAKVTSGTFEALVNSGFTTRDNGIIRIEGGILNANQIRTSILGSSNVGGYYQTGGTANLLGGNTSEDYYVFNLTYEDNVFFMSGGTLHVHEAHGKGGIFINSKPGNYNVSGGEVIMEISDAEDFVITSRAPFWDVSMRKTGTGSEFRLDAGTGVGSDNIDLPAQTLKVLNDLTIETPAEFNANGTDVEIGRNFDLQDGAIYTHGNNTTRFNGDQSSTIYVRNATNAGELKFYNLILAKDQRYNNSLFHATAISSDAGRALTDHPTEILGDLYIQRGELNLNEWETDLKGNLEIVDGQILADATNPGKIVLNGTALQTVKGHVSKEQAFGNIELNNTSGAKLLSDINVTNFSIAQGVLDLDIYNLDVNGLISTTGSYSNSLMYKTAGNASDGGLSLYIDFSQGTSDTEYVFPLGTGTEYNPAKVIQSATIADAGKITINPVSDYHPSATNLSKTIPHYWVVDTAGFSDVINYDDLKYTFSYSGTFGGNVNKGLNLWPEDYTWYSHNNVVNEPNLEFPVEAYLTGDYTIGNQSEFNKPIIYYSRIPTTDYIINTMPQWSDGDTWSIESHTGAAAGDWPKDGDIAIIGYGGPDPGEGGNRHHVAYRAADNYKLAKVVIDASDVPGVWASRLFIEQGATIDMGVVDGEGTLDLRIDPANPIDMTADLGSFINNYDLGSRILYYCVAGTNVELPSVSTRLPNVRIEGGGNRTVHFPEEVLILGGLTIDHDATFRIEHDLTVNGDLRLGSYHEGILEFPDDIERTLTIKQDLRLTSDNASEVKADNTTENSLEHKLIIEGNIELAQGNRFDLFSNNTGGNNVILEVLGDQSTALTNVDGMPVELYRIIMNKSAAGLVTFDIAEAVSINGPTDGDDKAIELISGRLGLRNAGIDVTLTSGGADFEIPGGSELWLGNSTTARLSGSNTGIRLDGKLTVGSNVKAWFNQGTNNYIEYTASGNSELLINGGGSEFLVGSQIRRPLNSEGFLNFNLATDNATVIIGTDTSIPGNGRGVFEISGSESQFTQIANSKIIIANVPPTKSEGDFYLNMDVVDADIQTGSSIQFGNASTAANTNFTINSNVPTANILTDNSSLNNPVLSIKTLPLTISENLTIAGGSEFDANGLQLNIGGDFINSGSFTANGNTTVFNGGQNQSVSGPTSFYNLSYTSAHDLAINDPVTTEGLFEVSENTATFSDNGNTLTARNDIDFIGTHIYGGSGEGILMQGTKRQTIFNNGTYGKLTIDNGAGVELDETSYSEIIITNALKLTTGVFEIKGHLLTLGENCITEAGNPFSKKNMIQTNLSFTDNGVKKVFPTGAGEFIYPIGSSNKYTPVKVTADANESVGELIVKAANERHSTIIDDAEETCEFVDTENVLQYYWEMRGSNFTSASGTVEFFYEPSDVAVNNACNIDEYDYITAQILADGSGAINKFTDVSTFDNGNQKLVFRFINATDGEISADYVAGLEDAIPDQVPIYETKANGSWTEASTWNPEIAGGPRGAIAIVKSEHTVYTEQDRDIFSFITEINGRLEVNLTRFHRLGIVRGTGTLYLQKGDLPAGYYGNFISAGGGTFEFGSTTTGADYSLLSSMPSVNNLIFSGKGERILPNLDLTIKGDLTINGDGATPTLDVLNEFNNRITVNNNITFNNGTFDAGTGTDAIFEIGGDNLQTISGTGEFTGTNAFNHFKMNNPGGLLLQKPVDIDNKLTFEFGVITTDATNILTLKNTADGIVTGASSSAYVNGPLNKNIDTGISGSFEFPTGKDGRYGKVKVIEASTDGLWQAEYYNDNPLNATDPGSMNPATIAAPLTHVSDNEYWRVKAPAAATAKLQLRWDNFNGGLASNINDMRIAQWNEPTVAKWNEFDATPTASGDNSAGTITTDITTSYNEFAGSGNFFTIASVYIPQSFTWEGNTDSDWNTESNWSGGQVPGAMDDISIPNVANKPIIANATAAEAAAVDLQTGSILTINAGGSLTANGLFTMNGTLLIKSPAGSGASGSFIDNGISGAGTAQIERFLTKYAFHYVSMPVAADINITSDLFTDIGSSYNPNFYVYNETLDLNGDPNTAPDGAFNTEHLAVAWDQHHAGDGNSEQLFPKIGYAHYHDVSTNQTAIFNGTPNTGEMIFDQLTYTLNDPNGGTYDAGTPQLYDGWNLVGNPYPSSVDWNQVVSSLTDIDAGIYVWDEANGGYASYVNGISGGTGNQNQYIAPMQAFFVRANGANPEFTLNNTHRAHSSGNFLKNEAKASPNDNLLSISILANGRKNITNVYFHPKATENFDKRYDAVSIFPASYQTELPTLYSIGTENTVYSTNALPDNAVEKSSLPIGVRVLKSGNYTLNFNTINGLDTVRVFMEDKYTGDTIYIKETPSYAFDHTEGDVKDRFVLHFKENKAPVAIADISDKQFSEKEAFSFTISEDLFAEPDTGDKIVKIEAVQAKGEELPEFLNFDNESFTFSGEAQNEDVGTYELSLKAYDTHGASASINFTLEILNVNDAPVLQGQIEDQSMFANEDFNLLIDNELFIDIDPDDTLSYSASYSEYLESGDLQAWLMFNPETLEFYGTPENSDAGTFTVILRATDLQGAWNETEFNVEVKQTTGVNDLNASEDPYIFPNPAREGFFIALDKSSFAVLTITDIRGSVVRELTFTSDKHYVPTEDLASGMYIVKIRSDEKSHFLKLFVD